MYCPKCGNEITHYSKNCRKCGTKLPYNKEFEKIKSGSDLENKKSFTLNKQIIFLSILGLIIIFILSVFAIGALNHSSSDTNSSFDDFINNYMISSDDYYSEEVEYYYPTTEYEVPKNNNENSNFSEFSNVFFSYDSFNQSI